MGRILKALRQLEGKPPQPQSIYRLAPPKQPGSAESSSHDPRRVEVDLVPDWSPEDDPAIEAAMARVEAAVAALDRQQAEPPATAPAASRTLAEAADCWPIPLTQQHREAYCRLARTVLAQVSEADGATLMFTGPTGGEGKTELLVSLAAAMAQQTAERLLLLDGNLHKPDLAGYLGLRPPRGLAHVLAGTLQWRQVVESSPVPRLDLLPGAWYPGPDLGRAGRAGLRPLLEELRSVYRLVLIDAASLAHAEVTHMAACCEGTYLVVRLRHTTARQLARAADEIRDCRGHLLGTVVIGG
jgi:Mrp family chromosome partitioning ATPase